MAQIDAPERPEPAVRPPGRRRTLLALAAVAVLVLAGIVAIAAVRPAATDATVDGPQPDSPPLLGAGAGIVGEPLPTATLPPLAGLGPDGGLRVPAVGEPMVLNFWASWCAPCVREMPMLQRVADDTGIAMVGVDYIDQADRAVERAEELGITYPLVTDEDGRFGEDVALLGTPTTLVVDADGIVRRQLTGELTERQLRDALAAVR